MDAVLSSLVEDQIGPGPLARNLIKECAGYLGVSDGIAFREYRRAVEIVFCVMEIGRESTIVMSPLAPRVRRARESRCWS